MREREWLRHYDYVSQTQRRGGSYEEPYTAQRQRKRTRERALFGALCMLQLALLAVSYVVLTGPGTWMSS